MRDDGVVFRVELVGSLGHGPVGDLLGGVRLLRSLDDGHGFHVPADALGGRDDLDRRAAGLLPGRAHVEGDAGDALALRRLHAGCAARVRIDAHVLVQGVHELPRLGLAHQLDPGRDRQIAGARRRRMRHHQLVLELGIGQVLPGLRQRGPGLLSLDRVVADDAEERVLARPAAVARAERRLERIGALGLVGLEQAGLLEQQQAGGGKPENDVGFGVVLLRQEAGGDDAGGVAHPLDLDVGHRLLDLGLEGRQLIVLERGVDRQLGLLRHRRSGDRTDEQGPCGRSFQILREHETTLPCDLRNVDTRMRQAGQGSE